MEMARDIVNKAKQIDGLITSLPGIDKTQEQQMDRIASLEVELKAVEKRHLDISREKDDVSRDLEEMINKYIPIYMPPPTLILILTDSL